MRTLRRLVGTCAALSLFPGWLPAQNQAPRTVAEHNRLGTAAMVDARDPTAALLHFEQALALDSLDLEANWRAALALVDIAKQVPPDRKDPRRDSLHARGERLARRAVRIDSASAEAQFLVGLVLGQAALTKGRSGRLAVAEEIRARARRTLVLDPTHDGAHHLLGRWHAEARRLSGLSRFFARTLLGGGILGESSWEEAVHHLELAVSLRPAWIYHRLDLAEVYADRKRWADARTQLAAIDTLPLGDVMDPLYKQRATDLLRRIEGR